MSEANTNLEFKDFAGCLFQWPFPVYWLCKWFYQQYFDIILSLQWHS